MRALFALLGVVILATPVVSHELAVYTVVVNSEGAQPADIPNGSLKEGDAAWFWMKDSTNNTTLVVELSKDGNTHTSPILYYECELDDNGSKVDEDCDNRYDFYFNQTYAAGQWDITFNKYVDGVLNETEEGSVLIEKDIHDQVVSTKESNTKQIIAGFVALASLLVVAYLVFSILDEKLTEEE